MPRVAEQPRPPREVQAVAAELERSQRRLQTVIDRYEALLTEKDRRLARAADEGPTSAPSERVIQALRRLVARR